MASQDIFRFVTLRGPQKITQPNAVNYYVDLLNAFGYNSSSFYTALSSALADPDPHDALVTAANDYVAGTPGGYLATVASIEAAFPLLANYYSITKPTAGTILLADLKSQIEGLLGATIVAYMASPANQAKMRQLIDNLLVEIILDKNIEKRDYLTSTLIVLHMAKRIEASSLALKQEMIKKAFDSSLVLPAPVFPLPYPAIEGGMEPGEPAPNYDNIRTAIKERFTLNQQLMDKVMSFWNQNTLAFANYQGIDLGSLPDDEIERDAAVMEYIKTRAVTGDIEKITEAQWETLSPEMQEFLEARSFGLDNFRITRVMAALEHESELIKKDYAGTVKFTTTVVGAGSNIYEIDDRLVEAGVAQPNPELIRGECLVKPYAIADLRLVKQKGPCYKPGEVAHIENIMMGEERERSTRRLEKSEETISTTIETEREEERSHQTTERYELQQETAKEIQQQMEFSSGLDIAANWGPVSINTALNFATSTSMQESNQQSSEYAKEVIDKSVSRILERVKEERKMVITREYEEIIKQSFKNTVEAMGDGTPLKNQVGIYRWIDKEYNCEMWNYGKRLMYEFMIPEPAAFHLHMKRNSPMSGMTLQKPADPVKDGIRMIDGSTIRLTSFDVIDENNYGYFVSAYNVQGVEPIPPMFKVVGMAFSHSGEGNKNITFSKNEIKVPEGYFAQFARASGGTDWDDHNIPDSDYIMLAVGMNTLGFGDLVPAGSMWQVPLNEEIDVVPVSFWSGKNNDDQVVYLNVDVFCRRSGTLKDKWKLKTFEAIMTAYNKLKMEYESALNAMKSEMAFRISETNPAYKREIEKQELKKGALRMATKKSPLHIEAFDAVKGTNGCGYPVFDVCDAMNEGKHVRFLEEAFDWGHMTYKYYPYYYARVCEWRNLYQLEDSDYLFNQFLKAGYARLLVPVTPGMELHVLHYIQTGQIWEGENPPVVIDAYTQSLMDDINADFVPEPVEDVEPWKITLPSTLVTLQCESGCIDEEGLPCLDTETDGGGDPKL